MGVLIEAFSIVIRRVSLEQLYPGGERRYRRLAPNETYCADDALTRVGFMVRADVQAFVEELQRCGLLFHDGRQFQDIAVVDQMTGPTAACPWLDFGRHQAGYAVAWIHGGSPLPLAHPPGWTPTQSASMQLMQSHDIRHDLRPMARRNGVETFLECRTGGELHTGRTSARPLD